MNKKEMEKLKPETVRDRLERVGMDIERVRSELITKTKDSGDRRIKCPICNKGHFMGIFYFSCDNPKCDLYDSFAMDTCRICRRPRVFCSC